MGKGFGYSMLLLSVFAFIAAPIKVRGEIQMETASDRKIPMDTLASVS
jgi:hypothetical protein